MGVGPLRVFNDDRLVPGADWPMHPHRDVEGVTYVVEGRFEDADSLGNDGVLGPGGVQRMTLGRGAMHSERNGSDEEPMRFLQLWILPDTANLEPEVEQRQFTEEERHNRLLWVLGSDGDGVVGVHQDAEMYAARLDPRVEVDHSFQPGRAGYLYLMDGALEARTSAGPAPAVIGPGDAVQVEGPEDVASRPFPWPSSSWWTCPRHTTPVGVWADA
jgi:redox-sensitive bicupin YhaK (pirin superfamily)